MNSSDLAYKAIEILSPILMSVLVWAAAKLAAYIRAKTKNEWLKGALVRLDDAVVSVVRELQQTVVNAIKAASADGVLTEDEKKKIKADAIANIKSYLGTKGLLELAKILGLDDGALEKLISTKIESAVLDLRNTAPNPQ